MRLTKIVCTLGPSCNNLQTLRKMHKAGMNVLRINLSHATDQDARRGIELARTVSPELGVLFDTKGPELRTGTCPEPIVLREGQRVEIRLGDGTCTPSAIYIRGAGKNVTFKKGDAILLADGTIELKVVEGGKKTVAKVVSGNILTSNKNASFPSVGESSQTFISKKDREDLALARELDVEFVAASFIRNSDDVRAIKRALKGTDIQVISKIEHAEAIKNFDRILAESDGIMVARGDLGLSLPLQRVPLLQKGIIRKCNENAVPVITATEVLESMTYNSRPTRAEVGDVANAVFDGTDAIMLSGETARGKYPVKAVEWLARIAQSSERIIGFDAKSFLRYEVDSVQEFIGKSAYNASFDLAANAIITHTFTGATARQIAQYRPRVPVLAMTTNPRTFRQLSISFGIRSVMSEVKSTTDVELKSSALLLIRKKYLKPDARVVVTIGSHTGRRGATDVLRIGTLRSIAEGRLIEHD